MVSLFCKGHSRILKNIRFHKLKKCLYRKGWYLYTFSVFFFTLWSRSGVQINTASANFSLSATVCQSVQTECSWEDRQCEPFLSVFAISLYLQRHFHCLFDVVVEDWYGQTFLGQQQLQPEINLEYIKQQYKICCPTYNRFHTHFIWHTHTFNIIDTHSQFFCGHYVVFCAHKWPLY